MIGNKFWDSLALLIILLFSLALIASLIQLISGGAILETFSSLTLKVINILFAVSILMMIIIVVMENSSPANTMAWLLVLIFLPVVGFILYLFFGRNWRKRRIFGKKSKSDIQFLNQYLQSLSPKYEQSETTWLASHLNRLLENNAKAVLSQNNALQIYADTPQAFNAILESIRQARQHVHLEYFSIANDETGNRLKEALIQKAAQGVQIRFIYDDVGCWNLARSFKTQLRKAGIEFLPFSPVWVPFLNSRLNYRNHRKLVVVDGREAFLGGLNIGDRYLGKHHYFGYWRDSLVAFQGEAVLSLQAIFMADWHFVSGKNLLQAHDIDQYLPEVREQCQPQVPLQIAASGPDSDQASILQLYFAAITSARQSIDISSPYLVLNESLLMALKTAAIGGARIRILIPSKADHFMVYWASRSYLAELLEVGIQIWEYQKGFIHAKQMIVDNEVLLIGTANMDLRSFNHNLELTAAIYDKPICLEATAVFEQDLLDSSHLDKDRFAARSVIQKSKESLCRLVSPLL